MSTRPYTLLGGFIARKRESAAMPKQADLARRVGCSQQSVSRWEAGLSRPRREQLAALAAALGVKPDELSELAGYAPPEAVATTLPLPVDLLSPETFERFVEYLLSLKYPGADVRRAGTSGHTQGGTDVLVTLKDDRKVISVQCKRVREFGPEDARRAISKHTVQADQKILALSRVASPQTAEVFASLPDWDLWDSDRLSRIFRMELTEDQQDRLVDVFFRGQRRSLTGRSELGPWQTGGEFFEPFVGRGTIFSHDLDLVGREADIADLERHIESNTPVILVVAGGGMGKSRLLKEAVERVEAGDPRRTIRFLSPTAEMTRASIDALGPHPKTLVIDDAHDRDGLAGVIEMAASPANKVQVVISTRPYAEARIKREAALYSIEDPPLVRLERLSRNEIRTLASEALAERGAPEEWIDPVVAAANDSPLVVVMAARLVAKEGVPVELAKKANVLRDNILGRFERVITGDLGEPGDEAKLRTVLRVLALVQPFHHNDPGLLDLIQQTVEVAPDDAGRLIRLLVEGGVLYQRGTQHRLMPDLLGDYIIESSCVSLDGNLTPFVLRAWDVARPSQLSSILVNLGRLDWRRSDGDPSNSRLLEPFWRDLEKITSHYDERFSAVKSVAVFQPRQALDFVQAQLDAGQTPDALSGILRSVAYSSEYLGDVCLLLWEMGRHDSRETGPHPNHPFRVLTELAQFEARKPISINRQVLRFGSDLLDKPEAWTGHYTPLDLLAPMLSTEGTTTESTGRAFSISSFLINYDAVKPLRDEVIGYIIALLHHGDPLISFKAGQLLQSAVRLPMGMMGSTVPNRVVDAYRKEFAQTLESVRAAIEHAPLPLMTPIAIAQSVSWLAGGMKGAVGQKAKAILALEPTNTRFKLRSALIDGFGWEFRRARGRVKDWDKEHKEWLSALVTEVSQAFPTGEALRAEIEAALDDIRTVRASDNSAYGVVGYLLNARPDFGEAVLEDATGRPDSPTAPYVAAALQTLMQNDPARCRSLTHKLATASDQRLRLAAVSAYWGVAPTEADLDFFRTLLTEGDIPMMHEALRILMRLDLPRRTKIELTKSAKFKDQARLADDVALIWRDIGGEGEADVNEADAAFFLAQARTIPKLEGHWLGELLATFSERFPGETIRFFTERVWLATERDDFEIRPVNHGPYVESSLRFAESPAASETFRYLWNWLREHEERQQGFFRYHAQHLFEAVFAGRPDFVAAELDRELPLAGRQELLMMEIVLREGHHSFVFKQRDFVVRYLDRCKAVDAELTESALSTLYACASSFMRTGVMGEPMPQDIELRENAKEALKHVSRLSPAHKLYSWLLKSAEADIERSRAEAAALDDEE